MPNNGQRAAWALMALDTHSIETGVQREDAKTRFGDLMCNLRHLADLLELDFDAQVIGSRQTYEAEIAEDGGPCLRRVGGEFPITMDLLWVLEDRVRAELRDDEQGTELDRLHDALMVACRTGEPLTLKPLI